MVDVLIANLSAEVDNEFLTRRDQPQTWTAAQTFPSGVESAPSVVIGAAQLGFFETAGALHYTKGGTDQGEVLGASGGITPGTIDGQGIFWDQDTQRFLTTPGVMFSGNGLQLKPVAGITGPVSFDDAVDGISTLDITGAATIEGIVRGAAVEVTGAGSFTAFEASASGWAMAGWNNIEARLGGFLPAQWTETSIWSNGAQAVKFTTAQDAEFAAAISVATQVGVTGPVVLTTTNNRGFRTTTGAQEWRLGDVNGASFSIYDWTGGVSMVTFDKVTGFATFTGAAAFGGTVTIPGQSRLELGSAPGVTYMRASSSNSFELVAQSTSALRATSTLMDVRAGLDFAIAATKKFYFDAGIDTYIHEATADNIDMYLGGTRVIKFLTTFFNPLTDVALEATKRLYLDGGGDTYWYEATANNPRLFVGGTQVLSATTTAFQIQNVDLSLQTTKKFYLDGGADTYIHESSANLMLFVLGGVNNFGISTGGAALRAGGKLHFDGTNLGGDTYLFETSANVLRVVAGGLVAANFNTTGFNVERTKRVAFDGSGSSDFIASPSAGIVEFRTSGNAQAQIRANGVFDFFKSVTVAATKAIYLDGGANTYIFESSADVMDFYTGGSIGLRVKNNFVNVTSGRDLSINTTQKFYLDGGSNTYIQEQSADQVDIVTGGSLIASFGTAWVMPAATKFYFDGGSDTYLYESSVNNLDVIAGNVLSVRFNANGMKCQAGQYVAFANDEQTRIVESADGVMSLYAANTKIVDIQVNGIQPQVLSTTATAANLYCASAGNLIKRSTSSKRYKKKITTLDLADAQAVIAGLRAVTFQSKIEADDCDVRRLGFIAEEVFALDAMLAEQIEIDGELVPDAVNYALITAPLAMVAADNMSRIAALESRVAQLETN